MCFHTSTHIHVIEPWTTHPLVVHVQATSSWVLVKLVCYFTRCTIAAWHLYSFLKRLLNVNVPLPKAERPAGEHLLREHRVRVVFAKLLGTKRLHTEKLLVRVLLQLLDLLRS